MLKIFLLCTELCLLCKSRGSLYSRANSYVCRANCWKNSREREELRLLVSNGPKFPSPANQFSSVTEIRERSFPPRHPVKSTGDKRGRKLLKFSAHVRLRGCRCDA